MASAVIAVFDEFDEAQSTVNELISAGFEPTEVKMDEEELFGEDEFKAYDEAVRHGRHVVTAYASTDERSDLATEVMANHNPVGLDESSSGVRVFHDMYEVPVEEDFPQRSVTSTSEDANREHWQRTYSKEGGRFEDWAPAYEHGTSAAANELFKDREWNKVENELKTDWERKHPESKWERFKESVKHAFSFKKD